MWDDYLDFGMPDASSWDWGSIAQTGASLLGNVLQLKAADRAPRTLMAAAPPIAGPLSMAGAVPTIIRAGAGLLTGAGAVVRAGAGLVMSAAGRVRGVMLASGRFISSKKGAALAKRVGIDAAAAALGIGAVEMAQMVLAASESRGRRRGITAASMRTTRRTIRQVTGLHRQIAQACSSSGFARRRSSGGARFPARISASCRTGK